MDKEYIILDTIEKNSKVTQRELSKKTGLSLGSVNLLLNTMVREGLIKINQIPANRVAYMLTPKGMAEKINKTYNYIKYHYRFINDTKNKIIKLIEGLLSFNSNIFVILEKDDISDLVRLALIEVNNTDYGYYSEDLISKLSKNKLIITVNIETSNLLKDKGFVVENLIEKL